MITRIVRMEFQADRLAEFHRIFDKTKHKIRLFPGCRHLELHGDPGNPNVRYTFSIWNSEKELNDYRESELFLKVWPRTKALFGGKPLAYSLKNLETVDL